MRADYQPVKIRKPLGLAAPDIIKQLLDTDPALQMAVRRFIESDQGATDVQYAGPPDEAGLLKLEKEGNRQAVMPCVTIKMMRVLRLGSGEEGVELNASEKDLAEMDQWPGRFATLAAWNERKAQRRKGVTH